MTHRNIVTSQTMVQAVFMIELFLDKKKLSSAHKFAAGRHRLELVLRGIPI